MTVVENISQFACEAEFGHLAPAVVDRLKMHIIDAFGCAFGALDGAPIRIIREQVEEFGGCNTCTLIGGGRAAPDHATLYNGALTRYLDFMDNFIADGETCHPSDNLGAVLAAVEYADGTGRDLLTSLAVAYQIQCRLAEVGPVMALGFDHTTHMGLAVASAVAKALGLTKQQAANAIALAGSQAVAFAVVRSAPGTMMKGIASAIVGSNCIEAAFLARRGMTAPLKLVEGVKGMEEALRHRYEIDWASEPLDIINRCSLKSYNAEVHTQSAIEGILELRRSESLTGNEVTAIDVEIFHTAYNIVGGGEYGDRHDVHIKEQADHSLPYLMAVALLDGEVWPEQFLTERIEAPDVQTLLKKVTVHPVIPLNKPKLVQQLDPNTRRYPEQLACTITVEKTDGSKVSVDKTDYDGFYSRPMTWEHAEAKFRRLSERLIDPPRVTEILTALRSIESLRIRDLMSLCA
jgi:2-methylcitrate dehydratase